jgi:hypothetical protein
MLTDGDRQWLEGKFSSLQQEIKESGSKIHKLDTEMRLMKAGSPHKCAEEILRHEVSSWSHNPKKAIGLGVSIIGLVEGVKALFFHK